MRRSRRDEAGPDDAGAQPAADDASADTAPPKQKGAKKKGAKKKKLLVVVALVVAVVGAAAFTGKIPGMSGSATPAAPVPGEVVTLDAVTLNLADGHYLKLGLALQMVKEKSSAEGGATTTPAAVGAKALDLAISQFGGVTMSQLLARGGRDRAKAALLAKVVKAYDGKVLDIYFTEFVMQ